MALKKQNIMNVRPFRPSGYITLIFSPFMVSSAHEYIANNRHSRRSTLSAIFWYSPCLDNIEAGSGYASCTARCHFDHGDETD
jgi:hypothetical protein